MLTSARSAFLHCSRTTSLTSRTAVYGPVRTVVWQGSTGNCRPYADQTPFSSLGREVANSYTWRRGLPQNGVVGNSAAIWRKNRSFRKLRFCRKVRA
jgi:hypothetical protein